MMASPRWALLLVPLALAGCAANTVTPAAADETAPAGETLVEVVRGEDGSSTEVYELSGTVTGFLWTTHLPEDAPLSLAIPVRKNASALRFEVSWEGNADFDALLQAPRVCEEGSTAPRQLSGLDCVLLHGVTRQSGDGWFQDASIGPSPSALALDAATLAEWNACKLETCTWSGVAYYNAATQTPFTLHAEVDYPPAESKP